MEAKSIRPMDKRKRPYRPGVIRPLSFIEKGF
jgi:hypothetical protein